MPVTVDIGQKVEITSFAGFEERAVPIVTIRREIGMIRYYQLWHFYDFPRGEDQVKNPIHIERLKQVAASRALEDQERGGFVMLGVQGAASSFKKDPRYDNDALADRRRESVINHFIKNKLVPPRELGRGKSHVLGIPTEDGAKHRAVTVAEGKCANNRFELHWFKGETSQGHDVVHIQDLFWRCQVSYRLAPIGAPAGTRGRLEVAHATGQNGWEMNIQMLMPGAEEKPDERRNSVAVDAFANATVTFKSVASVTTLTGVTRFEQVPFEGLNIDDRANPPLLPDRLQVFQLQQIRKQIDSLVII